MTVQFVSHVLLEKLLAFYQNQLIEGPFSPKEPFLKVIDQLKSFPENLDIQELHCEPGEIIFNENDFGNNFYIIRSGHAAVLKGELPSAVVLAFRDAGDFIGEMALLGGGIRSASVVALDAMELWVMNRDLFYSYLRENPNFSIGLMGMLSQRLRISDEERSQRSIREIEYVEAIDGLRQKTYLDELTTVFNRRYFNERIEREIIYARQAQSTVSFLMLDMDCFKRINDTYSHKAGDLMLNTLGVFLKNNTRLEDFVCRYGGDEFVVGMPGVSLTTSCERAEQIRSKFQALYIPYEDQKINASVSMGIAAFPNHGSDAGEVLLHADQALYRAKLEGRNRAIVWTPEIIETIGTESTI